MVKRIRNTKLCPILNAKIMAQSMEEVPVIVQFNNANLSIKRDISSLSTRFKSNLPIIDGFAGHMTTESIYKIVDNPEIKYISFDSEVHTLLDIASPTIDAYFPHDKGYKGEGITVAIIDTGTAPHRDLTKPSNRIIGFKDMVNNREEAYDDNGHGSHVAGIIAGNGSSSRGRYGGVAPRANILSIKALDENGGGSSSNIIKALAYIIENRDKYNTRIVNLSIGTPANSACKKDPLCQAVNKAVESGLVVVVAAGNSGPKKGTILSPGTSIDAITVGAADDKKTRDPFDDTIAAFSSRGPTREGLIKPDLFAPGVNINSISNKSLDGYTSLSGTSMATPLVSGAIALILNKNKELQPKEVKDMLIKSSINLKDPEEDQGFRLLNLKLLFNKDKNVSANKTISKSPPSTDHLFENMLILLMVIFLLDSKM